MRRIAIAALTAGLALVAAAPAGAAGKQREVVERFTEPYAFSVDCGDFGDYDFDNVVSGVQRIQLVDVYGRDGTLQQTIIHANLSETDRNSVTGGQLRLRTAVHEVWDYASATRTLTGAVFMGTQRGKGTYVHDTGRITMTLDTRVAQFVAGPHEAFFAGGIDIPVCAALATA